MEGLKSDGASSQPLPSQFEVSDIKHIENIERHAGNSRVTVTFGLRNKLTDKLVQPSDYFVKYLLLYKTNADCNNDWVPLITTNQPVTKDTTHGHFDGAIPCDPPLSSCAITIPGGQIATFRVFACVSSHNPIDAMRVEHAHDSALPVELWRATFDYLSASEQREYVSGVCKAWRNIVCGYPVTAYNTAYIEPKEVSVRVADAGASTWAVNVHYTQTNLPKAYDNNMTFLQWQSTEIRSENPIYSSFMSGDKMLAEGVKKVASYKLYASCALLKQRSEFQIPIDPRDKLYQYGMPSAGHFYFCKPLAPNSIVFTVITVKKKFVQPVEMLPTDKFGKLLTLLHGLWPSVQPYEMKFKMRSNGKRFDISNSDQTLQELGIVNFSWLKLDISHPDTMTVNVYQIDNKKTSVVVRSTTTIKQFKELVYTAAGVTPSKDNYIMGIDESSDEATIGGIYSKEHHLLEENFCFLYENSKATSCLEVVEMGQTFGRQVLFSYDATGETFRKYLVAAGKCRLHNRLRSNRVLNMESTLRDNGVHDPYARIHILH